MGDKLNYTIISVFGSLHLYKKEENGSIKWRQDDVEDSLGTFYKFLSVINGMEDLLFN